MEETQVKPEEQSRPVQLILIFHGPVPRQLQPAITSLTSTLNATTGITLSNPPEADSMPKQVSEKDPWLGIEEAADYLGVSKSTLYKYRCEGRIESRKVCGRIQFRLSTLEEFKNAQIRPAR